MVTIGLGVCWPTKGGPYARAGEGFGFVDLDGLGLGIDLGTGDCGLACFCNCCLQLRVAEEELVASWGEASRWGLQVCCCWGGADGGNERMARVTSSCTKDLKSPMLRSTSARTQLRRPRLNAAKHWSRSIIEEATTKENQDPTPMESTQMTFAPHVMPYLMMKFAWYYSTSGAYASHCPTILQHACVRLT